MLRVDLQEKGNICFQTETSIQVNWLKAKLKGMVNLVKLDGSYYDGYLGKMTRETGKVSNLDIV